MILAIIKLCAAFVLIAGPTVAWFILNDSEKHPRASGHLGALVIWIMINTGLCMLIFMLALILLLT